MLFLRCSKSIRADRVIGISQIDAIIMCTRRLSDKFIKKTLSTRDYIYIYDWTGFINVRPRSCYVDFALPSLFLNMLMAGFVARP